MAEQPPFPDIEVFAIETIEGLCAALPHRRKFFTLFLAWNAPFSKKAACVDLFRPLVDRGMTYFCAWGNRCEEVHDAVDECVVESELEAGERDYFLMTTWHSDEPLEEALEFFSTLAIPSETHVFADFERFAVTIGNPEWAQRIELHLAAPASE